MCVCVCVCACVCVCMCVGVFKCSDVMVSYHMIPSHDICYEQFLNKPLLKIKTNVLYNKRVASKHKTKKYVC